MNDRCLQPEELADFADQSERSAEDSRWAHVDDCARCQALLQSYTAFMDPVNVPRGADLEEADSWLGAALDREIRVGGEVVRPPTTVWTPFRVRTLAAAAAVVIVAVGLSVFGPGPEVIAPEEPVLRGIGASAEPFRCQMAMLDEGGFRVTWPRIAEATGYRVVVFGQDLMEMASFDIGLETSFELQLPEGAAFCRVVALREGDELGRSEPAYFEEC